MVDQVREVAEFIKMSNDCRIREQSLSQIRGQVDVDGRNNFQEIFVLLNTCHREFEGADTICAKLKEMNAHECSEKERLLKRRTPGNIPLIAELLKQKILPKPIVHACIQELFGEDVKAPSLVWPMHEQMNNSQYHYLTHTISFVLHWQDDLDFNDVDLYIEGSLDLLTRAGLVTRIFQVLQYAILPDEEKSQNPYGWFSSGKINSIGEENHVIMRCFEILSNLSSVSVGRLEIVRVIERSGYIFLEVFYSALTRTSAIHYSDAHVAPALSIILNLMEHTRYTPLFDRAESPGFQDFLSLREDFLNYDHPRIRIIITDLFASYNQIKREEKEGTLSAPIQNFTRGEPCDCQAKRHNLVNNCLGCGKIICEQEGEGPCSFCGREVSHHDRPIKYLRGPSGKMSESEEKANILKKKLLAYDRNETSQTAIIDDQSDYFNIEGNSWLSPEEKKELQREELEKAENMSQKRTVMLLDPASLKVSLATEDDIQQTDISSHDAKKEKVKNFNVEPSPNIKTCPVYVDVVKSLPRIQSISRRIPDSMKVRSGRVQHEFCNLQSSTKRTTVDVFDICMPKDDTVSVGGIPIELFSPLYVRTKDNSRIIEYHEGNCEIQVLKLGMILLKNWLSRNDQVNIVEQCQRKMHLWMMCLGKDWDPKSGLYGEICYKDRAVPPPIPREFISLVYRAIHVAHDELKKNRKKGADVEHVFPYMDPDVCIINFYTETGRLGLHQDKDESNRTLYKGLPVSMLCVSLPNHLKVVGDYVEDSDFFAQFWDEPGKAFRICIAVLPQDLPLILDKPCSCCVQARKQMANPERELKLNELESEMKDIVDEENKSKMESILIQCTTSPSHPASQGLLQTKQRYHYNATITRLVKKEDRSNRLCIDYRWLKQTAIKDEFSTPKRLDARSYKLFCWKNFVEGTPRKG